MMGPLKKTFHYLGKLFRPNRIGKLFKTSCACRPLNAANRWQRAFFQRLRAVAIGAAQVASVRADKYLPIAHQNAFPLHRRENLYKARFGQAWLLIEGKGVGLEGKGALPQKILRFPGAPCIGLEMCYCIGT